MTEDERRAGRWQGNVDAKIEEMERRIAAAEQRAAEHTKEFKERERIIQDHRIEIRRQGDKLSLLIKIGGAFALMLSSAIFKIWADGGF